ncbi:MAG: ELWxxDGT repeat protein [Bacteroidota bacterium]
MRSLQIILFVLLPFVASAQITLLKDINNGSTQTGSNPNNMTTLGSYVYFSATDGVTGTELWRSDGTAAGTTQVKDIRVGDASSSPTAFTVVGSYIYFAANDGTNGIELWRTDGTAAGTILVKDINPGSVNGSPNQITPISSTVAYFVATDATNGRELWKLDASANTVTLVTDINSGTVSSSPSNLTYVNGTTIYFSATDASTGNELWKTDGTTTTRIKDIQGGSNSSYPSDFALLNGTSLIFQADDGVNGPELWVSNGTTGGTVLLKNINTAASTGSYPSGMTTVGSYVFFEANDGTYGYELWKTDGTNTSIAFNIATSAGVSSYPGNFVNAGGTAVFFTADDGFAGNELYRYTTSGVLSKIDINPLASSSYPANLTLINNILYFQAATDAAGYELFRYNNGTSTLSSVYSIQAGTGSSYPYAFAALGSNDVLFGANDGSGNELWKYNIPNNAVSQVSDLVTGSAGSNPSTFVYAPGLGITYFAADDGTGSELWKTDGTAAGTVRVKDINTVAGATSPSYPSYLTMVGNTLYFQAYDGGDYELWKSDGTSAGTVKIDINPGASASSSPYYLTALGSSLVFQAYHPSYGYELWKYNGTTAQVLDIYSGTTSSSPSEFTVFGSTVVFSANYPSYGYEIFKYDLSSLSILGDINPGTASSYPSNFIVVGGTTIYFTATTTANGTELYKSTGVASLTGSTLVKDIAAGTDSSYPYYLTPYGTGTVMFQAYDATNGYELWKSDGTSGGTVLVKDIYSGVNDSSPSGFFEYNSKMYFVARDATNGYEMWVTDGTAANTSLFKSLVPGGGSGSFSYPTIYNGKMYMIATEATGAKIYASDGRSCGTFAVPAYPSAQTSTASELVLMGNKFIFSMAAKGTAREPFLFDPALVTFPTDVAISTQPTPKTVTMPSSVSLTVTATGTSPTYQWQKNGVNISNGGTISGATSATLTFSSTTDTDAGNYKVIVTGTCGQVTSTEVALTVNATTPGAQPTALTFSNPTTSSIGVSFTAASGSPSGYLVIRKKGSAPTDVPVDGTIYAAGGALGSSTVVKSSATTSVTDSGLETATQYFYAVFSYNGSSTLVKYLTTSPLAGSSSTTVAEPTQQPTNLIFTNVDGATLTGSYTAAAAGGTYVVLRKATSAPTATPADGTVYSVGQTVGDAVVAYAGDQLTFNDTGLNATTKYYYSVFYALGASTTINYNTTSPLQGNVTTLVAAPDEPTDLKFTNITSNPYIVSYTAPAVAPAGYLVLRIAGKISPFTDKPADGTTYVVGQTIGGSKVAYVGPNVTFNENMALAEYTYAVFAYNGSGTSINYNTANTLIAFIAPDGSPPEINNTTTATATAGQPVIITATVTEDKTDISSVTVTYRITSDADIKAVTKSMVQDGTVKSKYSAEVPSSGELDKLGVQYTITATNTASLSKTVLGNTAMVYTDQPFNTNSHGEDATAYRIIAIPMKLTNKTINAIFADDFGSNYDGVDWRMYHWDGDNTELNGSSIIEPGKGYWLIQRDGKAFDTGPGTTVLDSPTDTARFFLPIVQGFNQIGNPYNFNLLWADVQKASKTSVALKTYVGSYQQVTTLPRFQGGFIFSNGSGTLYFPKEYKTSAGRESNEPARLTNSIDQPDWEVMFNIQHDKQTNTFGGIGMNRTANVNYDDFDDFTLPRFLDYLELNHDKKIFRNISYTKDIIPTTENYTWTFSVESETDGLTTITWDNSYFGNNDKHLTLWDEEEGLAIDMRTRNSYSFNQSGARKFSAYYGSASYVAEKSLTNSVRIHSVTPNPADNDLTVTFSIPGADQSMTEVKVLNTLGQPVAVMYRGLLDGGMHSMTWSGKDQFGVRPAQGVYLVEVNSNGQKLAKRVVLK